MRAFIKVLAFFVLFALFLVWRFPYDSLVARAVREAEIATGSTILYKSDSAGPFGVKVRDLTVNLVSGASIQFDSARIFPTRGGLRATAYQGDDEMGVRFNGTQLEVDLRGISVQTGNEMIGTTSATGNIAYNVHTHEGDGTLGLEIPELGVPVPLSDPSVSLGSTFVIKNIGTAESPRTGVSTEIKLMSGDGNSTANGTISIEGQPPPTAPLLNGTLRFEMPTGRGTLRLSGSWDNPVTKIIPN